MRLQITALTLTSDWCTHKNFKYSGRGEETISGATLVWRDQRLALKVRANGKSYAVPTGNKAFPTTPWLNSIREIKSPSTSRRAD